MKKAFATILAFIYLASSIGATINIHYCMGRVYKVDFVNADKGNNCGMEKGESKGCCKNEVLVVKVNDSHQLVSNDIHFVQPVAMLHHRFPVLHPSFTYVGPVIAINNNSPPGATHTSLCILNCVFRL